ncbi:antitoxin of toxin-antitoxin stability system [Cupriavidus taiwanensis]|uniref:antitoxin of toxin-antitoxin stability system n=1 Tax=Cupriavidus taiwanensis TaxID=164546 RepID=UPI000E101F66|nr:antitoxin of toxin-antitoxin stability system [Cupriavidus taiwanensis]SPA27837.1 conserved hypothetical protein [Cupriavidus taiwanensis]SPA47319.1 conserved protein of unknown function [Cupriavidus taiwanensis]
MLVSEEIQLTFTLDARLRDAFIAEATARGLTPSQALQGLVREFLDHSARKRDYEIFLRNKVEASRASLRDAGGIPAEQIEAEFAAWRAAARRRA